MTFVGIDLAWGFKARTGLAVLDPSGRLLASGSCVLDEDIDAWLKFNAPGPTVVAVDAPLIVTNPSGMRQCEREIASAYGRYGAGVYPSNTSNALFNPPRGATLARRHGWEMDPSVESSAVRCLEVYPHAALVGMFSLGTILRYKSRTAFTERKTAMLKLLDRLGGVDSLSVGSSSRWSELVEVVSSATRPMHLGVVEDELDAIVCALVAYYWTNDRDSLHVYGDVDTGYIVAPSAPSHPATPRARLKPGGPRGSETATPAELTISTGAIDIRAWTEHIRAFAEEREWQQFHTPKNLTMALSVEASELVEIFQWLTPQESAAIMTTDRGQAVRDEVADVMTYLLRLADVLEIDLDAAMTAKVEASAQRYTVEKSKGSAAKR